MSEDKLIYSDIKFTIKNKFNKFINNDIVNFLRNNNSSSDDMQKQINILFLNVSKSKNIGLTLINEKTNILNEFVTLEEKPVFKGKYNKNKIDDTIIIKSINVKRLEDNTDRKRRVFKIYAKDELGIYDIQSAGILPVFTYLNKKYFLMINENKYDTKKKEWKWKGYSDFGGKIEYGDKTLFEAALREFNEETNFKFDNIINSQFIEERTIDTIISDKYNNKSMGIDSDQTKSIIFIIDFGELNNDAVNHLNKYGLYHFIQNIHIKRNTNTKYKFFETENVFKAFTTGKLKDSNGFDYEELHFRLRLYNIK